MVRLTVSYGSTYRVRRYSPEICFGTNHKRNRKNTIREHKTYRIAKRKPKHNRSVSGVIYSPGYASRLWLADMVHMVRYGLGASYGLAYAWAYGSYAWAYASDMLQNMLFAADICDYVEAYGSISKHI